jgi:putative phosphoesterase
MRICLFSDIHGNGPAFRAAHPMIMSEKADVHVFLGDLCGYYFDQNEIFILLQSIPNLVALKGNHDQFFLKILEGDKGLRKMYLKQYGYSMENLLAENTQSLTQWLSELRAFCSWHDVNLAACHGSPWDHLEGYVYPDSSLERFLDDPASLFFLGHTHHPMVRKIEDKLIVNPGSLGQPRGGARPSYAVIDCCSMEVIFRDFSYDPTALLRQIDELDGSRPYLKKHLLNN